jgi:hypothetical protein
MKSILLVIVAAVPSFVLGADPNADQVRQHFKSDNYTVTWGTPRTFDSTAELEIGDGAGHGFTLEWVRLRPGKECVDVLSWQFRDSRHPYRSKWPPDRAPVTVRHASMKLDGYAALLRDLAVVDAVTLHPIERDSVSFSTQDIWVSARLVAHDQTLLDLEWAGYWGSDDEVNYAKPEAAVRLAHEALKGLDFKDHNLTDDERGWASAKFSRDWKRFKDADSYWWVRERYIIMIGVVGNASALPTLRDVLQGDPKDRCVYHAINAVTRLTKKDVRPKPVEEMDVEKTRRRLFKILPEGK